MNRKMITAAALALAMGFMPSIASAAQPKLSNELLSVGQMPVGWSVDNSTSGTGPGCLAAIMEPRGIKQIASANVTLVASGGIPLIEEKLATFSNAATAFKKITGALDGCKRVSGLSGGVKATGTVGMMSFPHYGTASAAYSATLQVQGTTIDADFLLVREGNVVMGIQEANLSPVNVSQFRGFVGKALAKLK